MKAIYPLLLLAGLSLAQETPSTATPSPLVPILLELSEADRHQLETILLDQNLSIKEMNSKMDAFFATKDASLQSQYDVMKQAFQESIKVLNEEHEKAIKSCSPICQQADAQIRQVANNQDITQVNQNRQILQLYLAQTPEVQKELNQYAIFKRAGSSSSSSSSGF